MPAIKGFTEEVEFEADELAKFFEVRLEWSFEEDTAACFLTDGWLCTGR